MTEPGLEVNFLFRKIRASVLKSTGGGQDLAIYASLSDTPLFFKAPSGEKPAQAEPLAQPPPSEAARAWAEIKELKDIAVFEAFRKQYGAANPLYDTLAAQQIENLKRARAAVNPKMQPDPPSSSQPRLGFTEEEIAEWEEKVRAARNPNFTKDENAEWHEELLRRSPKLPPSNFTEDEIAEMQEKVRRSQHY